MSYTDLQAAQHIMHLRLIDAQQQFEAQDLPRGTTVRQPGWWSWQRDRLLSQVGRQLVSLGSRLEQNRLPQVQA
jgi:hypothetical protein